MLPRHASQKLITLAQQFPVVGIVGPRQSGKTTLAKELFSHLPYVSLEDLDQRAIAQNDTRWFINKYADGAVIDEVQNAPEILSYLQTHVDQMQKPGRFIITGSQNLIFSQQISQTLAGRIAIITLLPFSLEELKGADLLPAHLETILFKGSYPRIYSNAIQPVDWYPNYIMTYVERDVRQIKNIPDLNRFQAFLKLCAGRIGQVLNFSSLANDCGISHTTVKQWLSLLEASYLIYLLPPYYKNYNKRVIKSPKLYFFDTGIACSLLSIERAEQLETHYLKGSLFENLVMNEIIKFRYNNGLQPNVYFWRDKTGHEVDCLIESAQLTAVEIKSSQTFSARFLDDLNYFQDLSNQTKGFLVYNGSLEMDKESVVVSNFRNFIPKLAAH